MLSLIVFSLLVLSRIRLYLTRYFYNKQGISFSHDVLIIIYANLITMQIKQIIENQTVFAL